MTRCQRRRAVNAAATGRGAQAWRCLMRQLSPAQVAAAAAFNLLLVFAFLAPTRSAVATVVREKELRLREGMRILGLQARPLPLMTHLADSLEGLCRDKSAHRAPAGLAWGLVLPIKQGPCSCQPPAQCFMRGCSPAWPMCLAAPPCSVSVESAWLPWGILTSPGEPCCDGRIGAR